MYALNWVNGRVIYKDTGIQMLESIISFSSKLGLMVLVPQFITQTPVGSRVDRGSTRAPRDLQRCSFSPQRDLQYLI